METNCNIEKWERAQKWNDRETEEGMSKPFSILVFLLLYPMILSIMYGLTYTRKNKMLISSLYSFCKKLKLMAIVRT